MEITDQVLVNRAFFAHIVARYCAFRNCVFFGYTYLRGCEAVDCTFHGYVVAVENTEMDSCHLRSSALDADGTLEITPYSMSASMYK